MHTLKEVGSRGPGLTRLPENFAFAFKSVDKSRYKMWPRFSYRIDEGPVTLVHSFKSRNIPAAFNGSICAFLNQGRMPPRMAWLRGAHGKYELLHSHGECSDRLGGIEPRCCDEALMWGHGAQAWKASETHASEADEGAK